MTGSALTILEITAISVPLIAILVIQIFRTEDLHDRASNDVLEYLSRLLVGAALLFVATILAAITLGINSAQSVAEAFSIATLGMGLAFVTIVVLIFPMVALATFGDDTEQQRLSDTASEEDKGEEDLPPQRREDVTEDSPESETET